MRSFCCLCFLELSFPEDLYFPFIFTRRKRSMKPTQFPMPKPLSLELLLDCNNNNKNSCLSFTAGSGSSSANDSSYYSSQENTWIYLIFASVLTLLFLLLGLTVVFRRRNKQGVQGKFEDNRLLRCHACRLPENQVVWVLLRVQLSLEEPFQCLLLLVLMLASISWLSHRLDCISG